MAKDATADAKDSDLAGVEALVEVLQGHGVIKAPIAPHTLALLALLAAAIVAALAIALVRARWNANRDRFAPMHQCVPKELVLALRRSGTPLRPTPQPEARPLPQDTKLGTTTMRTRRAQTPSPF